MNRLNAKKVGTLFIKYAKPNKDRQAFYNVTISNYSIKTHYALSVVYYMLFVFCPYMLPSSNLLCCPSAPPPYQLYTIRPPLHIIQPP